MMRRRGLAALAVVLIGAGCGHTAEAPTAHPTDPMSASAAPTTTGTLSGRLVVARHSAHGDPAPLSGGRVDITGTSTQQAPVDTRGRFSVDLPAGIYRVSATSPDYVEGKGSCPLDGTVQVSAGRVTTVTIGCPIP